MPTAGPAVDRLFKLVFGVIFLAMVLLWIWNPLAVRFSLPAVNVFPYLPGLLIVGIVLYLMKTVAETYR